jgi:hypothetical protein
MQGGLLGSWAPPEVDWYITKERERKERERKGKRAKGGACKVWRAMLLWFHSFVMHGCVRREAKKRGLKEQTREKLTFNQ